MNTTKSVQAMTFFEWCVFLFWINHLPLLLIGLGTAMIIAGIIGTSVFTHIITVTALTLLLLLPFSSRKPLSLFRKLLTMSVGFMLLVAYLAPSDTPHHVTLVAIGIGGVYYFVRDYKRQLTKYKTIRKQSIDWFFDSRLHARYLNSKCSRQVFIRSAYRCNRKKGKKLHAYIKKEIGCRWYHFFPDSPKPLVGIWFPRRYAWLEKKLHTLGIETH